MNELAYKRIDGHSKIKQNNNKKNLTIIHCELPINQVWTLQNMCIRNQIKNNFKCQLLELVDSNSSGVFTSRI